MHDTPEAEVAPRRRRQAPARPRLILVAAVARNGVIGVDNRLPWRLPADLRRFRALTVGHRVVMGRKTFESLGRPLPDRENIVVTRNREFRAPGCTVVGSLDEALGVAGSGPVYCIGGAELYRQALPVADELILTEIDADFAGDTRWPPTQPGEWVTVAREPGTDPASGLRYEFVRYVRAAPAET